VTSSTDFYLADRLLTDEARALRDRARDFAETHVRPVAREAWEQGEFPRELVPRLGEIGIAGGLVDAHGEAITCYEAALAYTKRREQFGNPLASFQLVQAKLVEMLEGITTTQLLLIQLGRLRDSGEMTPGMSALAKRHATAMARSAAATARELLGGHGILQDNEVMRHLCDLEGVYTYEGTFDINTLIVGREITGIGAFA